MTTYAQFVTALTGMTVSSGITKLTTTPNSLNTADLPLSYPRLPSGDRGGEISTCWESGTSKTMQMVYVQDAGGQNTAAANFVALVALADKIETAVQSLDATLTSEILTYTLSSEASTMDTTDYWALVLTVTLTRV